MASSQFSSVQLPAFLARPQPTSVGAQPACLLMRHAAGSIPHAAGGTMSKAFTPTQMLKQILAEMRPPSQGDKHDSGFTIQSTPHHLTALVGALNVTRVECYTGMLDGVHLPQARTSRVSPCRGPRALFYTTTPHTQLHQRQAF
jgi:hypothetical protein